MNTAIIRRMLPARFVVMMLVALIVAQPARASSINAPATSATGTFTVSWTSGYELWLADAHWRVASAPATSASFSGLPAGTYRFILASCLWIYDWELGYTFSCGQVPNSARSVLVTGDPVPAIDESTGEAGTTPYRSEVSLRGGAQITVPLRTPSGVNGVALELSLSYDSARNGDRVRHVVDDLLGYGWSLQGVPYLHRCRVGQREDQAFGGLPTMTASDGLCLDGEPLVPVAGVHWRADTEYRGATNPDLKVVLRSTAGVGTWFEVRYPDGSVGRFGDTADSRVVASGQPDYFSGSVTPNEPYFWGLRKRSGAPGGELTVSYQRFDGYGILQPALISYGGAAVQLRYGSRSDLAPVSLGGAALVKRSSVLQGIDVRMNGKPVREYRLDSSRDGGGRERLERIQECGYDGVGGSATCLRPLRIRWVDIAGGAPNYPIAVAELVDGLGARTGFDYAKVTAASSPLSYAEAPFGALLAVAETVPTEIAAVAEYRRSDGRVADGFRRWRYGYKSTPQRSSSGHGYLGFHEVRTTDVQSGIVTYTQTRLDWPFSGAVSRLRSFDATFGSHGRELAREEHAYAHKVHGNGSRHTYRSRSTRWLMEGSAVVGGTLQQVSYCFRGLSGDTCPTTGIETAFATQRRVVTTSGIALSNPAFTPAFWGDVPARTIATQNERRSITELTAFVNTELPWIRGAVEEHAVVHVVPGQSARTVREKFTHLAGTRVISSRLRFPGDPVLERRLTRTFEGASGNLLAAETVQGANALPRTWRYATPYQDGRYVAQLTNPLGQVEHRTADDRFGQPAVIVDADGRSTTFEFDPFGRVVRALHADGTEITTLYERCDQADCGVVTDVEPALRVAVTTRNGSLQTAPTQVTYLDVLGREVLREVEALDPAQGYRSQRVGYDNQDRVQYVSRPVIGNPAPACTAAGGDCTWFGYDSIGRVIREDRPDGGVTTTSYSGAAGRVTVLRSETVRTPGLANASRTVRSAFDVLGQLIETSDAYGSTAGTTTTYAYDGHGNLATVRVGGLLVATLQHDLAGNRTRMIDASSGTTDFTFNGLGELTRSTDAKGQTTSYEYDPLGRLVRRIDAGGIAHTWHWDPVHATGQLGARSRPGFSESFGYDPERGGLVSIDSEVNVSGVWTGTQRRTLVYDSAGRLSSQQYPNGQAIGYAYSTTGYLRRVTSGGKVLHEWRSLDGFGNPVDERLHDGGLRTSKIHDSRNGLLTRIETGSAAAAKSIQDLDTTWRSNRTLYRRVDRRNTAASADDYLDTFSYDAVARLVRQASTAGAVRTLDFAYRPNGNLNGRTSSVAGDLSARDFAYGSEAEPYRLTAVTLGGVATSLSYDANGNVVRYAPTQGPFTWLRHDARNNVTRISVGPDENAFAARDEFWYDPDGQRFLGRETWNEGGIERGRRILYLGGDYEEVRAPAGAAHDIVQRIQVTPVARLVRRRDANSGAWDVAYEYVHRDHLGSVDVVTDGSGTVLGRSSFDPFGTRRAASHASDLGASAQADLLAGEDLLGSRGFTGHEHRNGTGFIHMNGRVYDPRLGRFVSPDPMVQAPGVGQSYNRYAYVNNDPMSRVDHNGLCGSETGFQLIPCKEFDEHIQVLGANPAAGGYFGSLNPNGGGILVVGPGGVGDGIALPNLDSQLNDYLSRLKAANPGLEVVSVTAEREPAADRAADDAGWLSRGLANLDGVGVKSLFGSGCVGIILGGCGAVGIQTDSGTAHLMVLVGVIPGAGLSVGTEGVLFSSDFQATSGVGTAVFVSGGVGGIGGSVGLAQGTNGFNVTGAVGYGFGLGGGVGFYYAMPIGSLLR